MNAVIPIVVIVLLLVAALFAVWLIRTLRHFLVALGLLAWVVAFAFGLYPMVRADRVPIPRVADDKQSPLQSYDVPNVTGAAAALGFSLAGGMCFIAAGLYRTESAARRESATTQVTRQRRSGSGAEASRPDESPPPVLDALPFSSSSITAPIPRPGA